MRRLLPLAALAAPLAIPAPLLAQADERPVDLAARFTRQGPAPTTNKIVGGMKVQAGQFPFQVALISSRTPAGDEHAGQFCGGSLIAADWVLTAAHCLPRTRPEEVDVYVGSTTLPDGGTAGDPAGMRLTVRGIIVHQGYVATTHENDIALLRLNERASDLLGPALLPAPDATPALNRDVTVLGWGRTQEGAPTTPQLMSARITVQDSRTCQTNYRAVLPGVQVTVNMFCAGRPGGGTDSCEGDSGGFLGVPAPGGQWTQLGIVSWGLGCARPQLYGVYTRLPNYVDWIAQMQRTN